MCVVSNVLKIVVVDKMTVIREVTRIVSHIFWTFLLSIEIFLHSLSFLSLLRLAPATVVFKFVSMQP